MSTPSKLIVIGGGGHAKVVIDTAQAAGWQVIGVADDHLGQSVFGLPYLGTPASLNLEPEASLVIAIGANAVRQRIAQELEDRARWATVIHPQATISSRARLNGGTVVFAGAIIQADTVIGSHVIINTGTRIDHDNQIGDYCHIAPGSVLTGSVNLATGVFIGAGAVILPGRRAGSWSTLGAGAVANRDLEPQQTYAGVPARRIHMSKESS